MSTNERTQVSPLAAATTPSTNSSERSTLIDSIKALFNKSSKSKKLGRVFSHKPFNSGNQKLQGSSLKQRRPRSQSEPDLVITESLVLDAIDVTFGNPEDGGSGGHHLAVDNRHMLKSASVDSFGRLAEAERVPVKAAKRLGLDIEKVDTAYSQAVVTSKERKGKNNSIEGKGSAGKPSKSDQKCKCIAPEDFQTIPQMPEKAARMLGPTVCTVPNSCNNTPNTAKSNSSSQPSKAVPSKSQTAEDFLRKIGAYAIENKTAVRGKTGPVAAGPRLNQPVTDPNMATSALLRKLANMESRHTATTSSVNKPLVKADLSLVLSRKRRKEHENTPVTNIEQKSLSKRCQDSTCNPSAAQSHAQQMRPQQRTTNSSSEINKTSSAGDGLTSEAANKAGSGLRHGSPTMQLPPIRINHRKLLKKCGSDSKISLPPRYELFIQLSECVH